MAMAMTTLEIPKDYGYVVATVASTFWLGFWQGLRVSSFRRPAGIAYPQLMAEQSEMAAADPEKKKAMYLFNCAQRAHQNFLENQPSFCFAILIAGLQYPLTSTGIGAAWVLSRILYARGYTSTTHQNGRGRMVGLGFFFCQWALFGLSAWTAAKMIM